jgi:lipoprotein NlpI
LGNVTERQLLAEANLGPTPSPNERRCEAYFYIGEMHLLAGNRLAARECFEKCVETQATTYFEYTLAKAELKRLQE